jgi:serine phosphatase RsbU (regulator of sigma subunit)
MALILFVVALLQTKTHTPLIHRILWVLLLLDVLFFAMSFFPPPTYSFALMGINFIAVPINLLILIAAVLSYRRGNPTAKYFLIAFSLLILGIIAALLKNFGLLPRVFITEYSIHIGSAIELIMLSFALAENLKLLKQEKEKAQALLLEELKEKSRLQEIANLELERKVNERTLEIQLQKAVIEEKNNDITASINYAQKIQSAILPREEELKAAFNDYFVLYQPRDIISGDFYWLSKKDHLTLITAADCTGHGVPGALMSMLGNSFLNEIVNENDIYNPADILDLLRNRIIQTLKQRETNTKDGMDMALCVIDEKKKQITFAGAYNPVYITKPETAHTAHEFEVYRNQVSSSVELISLPADRFPVGMLEEKTNIKFSEKLYHYQQGDCLYLFSDGLTDQFGGADGKKYRSKRLKDLLLHVFHSDMQSQKDTISSDFLAWKDQLDQVDDVLLVGIRLQ